MPGLFFFALRAKNCAQPFAPGGRRVEQYVTKQGGKTQLAGTTDRIFAMRMQSPLESNERLKGRHHSNRQADLHERAEE